MNPLWRLCTHICACTEKELDKKATADRALTIERQTKARPLYIATMRSGLENVSGLIDDLIDLIVSYIPRKPITTPPPLLFSLHSVLIKSLWIVDFESDSAGRPGRL